MLSENQQTTDYTKMMDFFISLGADEKKAAEISKIFEREFRHTSEPISAESLSSVALNNPNDATTKKDLRILELNIQKQTTKTINETRNDLLEKIYNTDLKIAETKTSLIKWMFSICLGGIAIILSSMFAMFQLFN